MPVKEKAQKELAGSGISTAATAKDAGKGTDKIATGKGSSRDDLSNPKGILGKDDFLKLLLTELKYQDPTEPMDTEKILQQTSQLATLESSNNTNKALLNLSKALVSSQQFATISAIGKIANLGDDTIKTDGKGTPTDFDLFIPTDAQSGTITITNQDGNTVQTIGVGPNKKGVYKFNWDGKDSGGNVAEAGLYHVSLSYTDKNKQTQSIKAGTYPITSVKFDDGKSLARVGSQYVPLDKIAEIY